MTTLSANKKGLLLLAGALFAFPLQAAAQYDSAQMANRLNRLENDVQTLNRAIYKGGPVPAPSGGSPVQLGANEERMSAIEDKQREITGQLEKLGNDVAQLKNSFERLKADTDQRFAAAPAPAPVAPQPASTIAPPQDDSTPAGTLGGSDAANALYQDAFAAVREGRYDEGASKFQRFLKQYPGHTLSPNAYYWLGETYYVRADYKNAAKSFAQGYQDYPKSGKAEDSLYKLALSLSKLGKTDDACLSLRQMQKSFPADGALQQKAQGQIAQLKCP